MTTNRRLQAALLSKSNYTSSIEEYIDSLMANLQKNNSKQVATIHNFITSAAAASIVLISRFYTMPDKDVAEIFQLADKFYEDAAKSLKSAKTRIEREHALKLFLLWSLQTCTLINRNFKQYILFGNQAALKISERLSDYAYKKIKSLLQYVETLSVSQHDTAFKYGLNCIKYQLASACEMLGYVHLSNGKLEHAIAYLSEEFNLFSETGHDNLVEICNVYSLFAQGFVKLKDLNMAEFYLKKLKVLLADETDQSNAPGSKAKLECIFERYFSAINLFIDKLIVQPSDDSFSDKLNIIQSVLRDEDLKWYTMRVLFNRLKQKDFDNASITALRLIYFLKSHRQNPQQTLESNANISLKTEVVDQSNDEKLSNDEDEKLSNDESQTEMSPPETKIFRKEKDAPIAHGIIPVSSIKSKRLECVAEEAQPGEKKIKIKTHGIANKNISSKEEVIEDNVMCGPKSYAESLGFSQTFSSKTLYPITSNEFPDGRYYGYYSRENTHPKQVSETTHQQAINTLISGKVSYKSPAIKLVKNRNNKHSDNVVLKLAPLSNFRMFGRKVGEVKDKHGTVVKTLIAFDIPATHTSQKKMY